MNKTYLGCGKGKEGRELMLVSTAYAREHAESLHIIHVLRDVQEFP